MTRNASPYWIRRSIAGGYELIELKTGKTVTSSAFREGVIKAKARLQGHTSWSVEEARYFYARCLSLRERDDA